MLVNVLCKLDEVKLLNIVRPSKNHSCMHLNRYRSLRWMYYNDHYIYCEDCDLHIRVKRIYG